MQESLKVNTSKTLNNTLIYSYVLLFYNLIIRGGNGLVFFYKKKTRLILIPPKKDRIRHNCQTDDTKASLGYSF